MIDSQKSSQDSLDNLDEGVKDKENLVITDKYNNKYVNKKTEEEPELISLNL